MSEKFVVGQWVTRKGVNWKVKEVRLEGDTLLLEGYGGAYVDDCVAFTWQVDKTYRTTLDGVTVRVDSLDEDGDILGTCSDARGYGFWSAKTGLILGLELEPHRPHLIPYLADEPQPAEEAATFSEFEDGGECDKDLNALESMLDEFVAERMACEAELRTSRDLVSRWESRIDAWQHAEKIAREKIERAKR